MKIAISGKGGVGKTTLTALLARLIAKEGKRVLLVDADPNPNLAMALGIRDTSKLVPIAQMSDLIAERTGAKPGGWGVFFRMNPKVDDLPEKLSIEVDGIRLMIMGTVTSGGAGCVCPESVMLKALVTHLVLYRDDFLIMDMEAGLEHLGRATAAKTDLLIAVTEPSLRSVETVRRIEKLAGDIGIRRVGVVLNKVRAPDEVEMVKGSIGELELLGYLPFDEEILRADLEGRIPYPDLSDVPEGVVRIKDRILALAG
ncbi:MAG TPA: carbon monoxide dehydrogenase [Proteobacteria bacterium]|nr:carbon monoxide dehydrogenase [Pseudomonadota bacterium]